VYRLTTVSDVLILVYTASHTGVSMPKFTNLVD